MSQEGYLARLGIDSSDFEGSIAKMIGTLAEFGEAFDQTSKVTDRAEAGLLKVASGGQQATTAMKGAARGAKEGTSAWQGYVKALADANQEYRKFRQGQVTGEGGGVPTSSLSASERKTFLDTAEAQSASLVSALRQEERQAADAAEMWKRLDRARANDEANDRLDSARQGEAASEAAAAAAREETAAKAALAAGEQRLLSIQAQRAQQSAAEANRQMEIRAALVMRRREEEELARAVEAAAAAERNRGRASAFYAGGVDSRLGQAPTGLRAADTGFAALLRAQEAQSAAASEAALARQAAETTRLRTAQKALRESADALANAQARVNAAMSGGDLREQVAATENAARAQQANTIALRESIAARDAENAALSRTRYALYDVSQVAAVTGAAMIATTGLLAGTAVAFERDFANVRRTVGVTGEAADDLYGSFLRLSTQIPTSFADLSSIGTLAGQLGVAESRVGSFTRTVAQFSATTDVTVDASATAFGRLDQLLGDVEGRYDRLGSSILNVGINSVATESQIINVASQIAAAGQQAGLSASEVIGLSSALASLGIAPEAARGTVLRVFSQINGAIAQGGDALERYAALSGMSADEFRRGWSEDFTGTFLAFLNGVQTSAAGAETTIRDLGITAVRDVNALLRLAQNGDVLSESLRLASDGFNDTSILADNFGIIAETNAAKIQVLGQTVLAFFATLGAGTSGPLSDFLDGLQRTTEGLMRFAETPVGQFVGTAVIALTALVGVLGLTSALALRGVGSWMALRTAIGATTTQSWLAAGGHRAMGAQLLGAAGAAGVFAGALKATGIGLLVTGGLWLLGEAVSSISQSMRSGAQVAEDYFGTLDGLTAAMVADDPTIVADAIRGQGTAAREASAGFDEMVLSIAAQRAEMQQMQAAIAAGNEALASQTFNIGENTRAWIENALMQSEAFTQMFENASQLQSLMGTSFTGGGVTVSYEAFSMEAMIDAAAQGGSEAATAYVDNWYAGLAQAFTEGGAGSADLAIFEALGGNEALSQVREMAEATGAAVEEGLAMGAAGDAASYLTDQLLGTADAGYQAADGLGAASDGAWITAQDISTLIDQAWGADNAARVLGDSMYQLGQDFANGGANAAFSGQTMQQVVQNILSSSGSAGQAAANMQGFFNMLVEGGYASAAQLAQLQQVIAGLYAQAGAGAVSIPVPKFNPAAFVAGINQVRTAAVGRGGGGSKPKKGASGGAAGAIRTLIDYANDLQKVMSRAFDIRFGSIKAADGITSTWREMREEAEEARKTIRDATAEMNADLREHQATAQALNADRSIVKYWLSVAEAYGDTLRAGELRAELAGIDQDLAENSRSAAAAQEQGAAQIADAQQTLNRGLTGNSEAAIENRAALMGLVSEYQGYLVELAESGMSQEQLRAKAAELKAEFLRQAQQLGYNSSELGVYAAAFDDATVAINRVPRNITVKANTNPALQALNEMAAQATARGRTAGENFRAGFGKGAGAGGGLGITWPPPWTVDAVGHNRGRLFMQALKRGANENAFSFLVTRPDGTYENIGQARAYRSGGWTGSGNPNDVAGLVHKEEFVLNQRGAQVFPREWLEAANQGRAPQIGVTAVGGGAGGMGDQRLLAAQLDLLAQIRDAVGITIAGDAIQASANGGNYVDSRRGR